MMAATGLFRTSNQRLVVGGRVSPHSMPHGRAAQHSAPHSVPHHEHGRVQLSGKAPVQLHQVANTVHLRVVVLGLGLRLYF